MSKKNYGKFKINQAISKHNEKFVSLTKNPKKFAKLNKKVGTDAALIVKEYEAYHKIKPRTAKLTANLMDEYVSKKNKGFNFIFRFHPIINKVDIEIRKKQISNYTNSFHHA